MLIHQVSPDHSPIELSDLVRSAHSVASKSNYGHWCSSAMSAGVVCRSLKDRSLFWGPAGPSPVAINSNDKFGAKQPSQTAVPARRSVPCLLARHVSRLAEPLPSRWNIPPAPRQRRVTPWPDATPGYKVRYDPRALLTAFLTLHDIHAHA